MLNNAIEKWSVGDASELYEIERWGRGYFSIGENGNVQVHPQKTTTAVDLGEVVRRIRDQGIELPALIRFNDILGRRIADIDGAFRTAIADNDFHGDYCCVYPIKVNQQRQVVQQILRKGRAYGCGLEVGSKPELLAVIALTDNNTPIICNGFKDADFIEAALLAHKIGRNIVPVIEKYSELDQLVEHANRLGVRPRIGMRVKLVARGAGRWQSSGGYRSKFGLTVSEVVEVVQRLESVQMTDCLQLLHFHLGSQITNIRPIKLALIEAARIYVDLVKQGVGLRYLDVGGGLGVDYDGSQTNFESSVNYTLQEYANDVVYHIGAICDEAGVPHPTIVSESGRAIAAHHSVLVFEVLEVADPCGATVPEEVPDDVAQPVRDLFDAHGELSRRNMREAFHDAQQSLEMANAMFSTGHLSLTHRSLAERLFWGICRRVRDMTATLDYVPEELQDLDALLAATYFGNFSIFQSLPDSWAIKQLFPVMPIHRLDERPTAQAIIGDVTCDSDGKIDRFVNRRDVRNSISVHSLNGSPYYLGVFLVGAYQEILGDLHNLFGDTNAVHVDVSSDGKIIIETIVEGDTVDEVLRYVQFDPQELVEQLRNSVAVAVEEQRIDEKQARNFIEFYKSGLQGYTYLE